MNGDGLKWPDGELAGRLVGRGLLTAADLANAARVSAQNRSPLAETVTALNLVPKHTVYDELAGIYGVPYVNLDSYTHDPAVTSLVDEKLARELEVVPLFTIGNSLTVALADPGDITVIDRLMAAAKCHVEPCLADRNGIREALNRAYGSDSRVKEFLAGMDPGTTAGADHAKAQQAALQSSESPVSQLVDLILTQAVRDRASDIHIDPEEDTLRIRFRIDGILYEIPAPPKYLHPFVVSRIKVMSNMDIAESRIPQDGHFRIHADGRPVEARVSCMPTIHGENMAIRILDTQEMSIALENLGVQESLLPKVVAMVRRPHGLVVVTGPTGCGKTTSLYAMLSKARSSERRIVTIEDPVERRMKTVTQIQINEKAGLTFSTALRSILRQDPDMIMVGEIRDQETAQLAVRAALTGRLLFSTLHTNDAPGAVVRLINMGIEPFLVSSALVGVIAQRLVRRICEDCKERWEIPPELRQRLSRLAVRFPDAAWRGKGCARCRETGYRGRTGIFEVLAVSPELCDMISAGAPIARIRARAQEDLRPSMAEDGADKVSRGATTLEEVLRSTELEGVAEPAAVPSRTPPEPRPDESAAAGPEKATLDLDRYRATIAHWLASKQE